MDGAGSDHLEFYVLPGQSRPPAPRRFSFADQVDGARLWILVEEVGSEESSDPGRPFRVACGFGEVPALLDSGSLLVDADGKVQWFASAEAAREGALAAAAREPRR